MLSIAVARSLNLATLSREMSLRFSRYSHSSSTSRPKELGFAQTLMVAPLDAKLKLAAGRNRKLRRGSENQH